MDFASPRRGFVTWRAQTQTESFRVENLHSKESHLAHSERESDERVQKFAPLLIGLRFWVARTRCRGEGGLQKCISGKNAGNARKNAEGKTCTRIFVHGGLNFYDTMI